MQLWLTITLCLAAVLAAGFFVLAVMLIRMLILASRSGSFPAWLLDHDKRRWVRGVAIYGSTRLEWRKLWGFTSRPGVVLKRQYIDVVEVPPAWQGSPLLILRLEVPGTTYSVAVSPGNASGLISWIDSSPPSGQIRS